jgi:ribosomal protein L12E/L44/L45/RPP1/RPP2
VCGLAALALYDGDAEITAENISALLKATNNEVAVYWPGLWASALSDGKCETLLMTLNSGGGGGGGGGAESAGDAAAPAAKAEKPKEEEVDALDGGMDMFGGGGGGGDY